MIRHFNVANGIIFTLLFVFTGFALGQTWEYQTIDSISSFIYDIHACINNSGEKFVLYATSPMRNLVIYKQNNSVWQKDSININTVIDDVVADEAGNIYITATSGLYNYTRLACIKYSVAGVTIDTAFTILGGTVLGTAIDLDNNSFPHISANIENEDGVFLLYCYMNETGWHSETITQINAYGGHTDIKIAANGEIMIASANPDHYGSITFARKQGGVWNIQNVFNYQSSTSPTWLSLELLNQINPSIAFHVDSPTGNPGSIKCMDYQNSSWQTLPVIDSSNNVQYNSQYLVSNDQMRNLGFLANTETNIKTYYYAYYFPGLEHWCYEFVDDFSNGLGMLDMVKDTLDNIYLFYLDNNYIKVGIRQKPSLIAEILPVSHDINLLIYPNPSNNRVKIEVRDIKESGNGKVQLLNLIGQLVYSKNIHWASGDNFIELDFSKIRPRLSSGRYYIQIVGKDIKVSKTITLLK